MRQYKAYNGPMPTTAAQLAVTTGTAIKTMLQLQTPATQRIKIIAWGVSCNGAAAAAGPQWELCSTAAINATVTAHVAAGLVPQNAEGEGLASQLTLATSGTGYTATAEGSVAAVKMYDTAFLQPTGAYVYQFPLGQEPQVPISTIVRIRVTAAAAVNALCWIVWEE
jgi:hypothetical protein